MPLLESFPELPLLAAAAVAALLVAAVRRTLVRVLLVCVLLLVASMVLHWPPPGPGDACLAGTLRG